VWDKHSAIVGDRTSAPLFLIFKRPYSGMYFDIGSSKASFPSPTSTATRVEVIDLVIEAIWTGLFFSQRRVLFASVTP
jgi:hypothetical protein